MKQEYKWDAETGTAQHICTLNNGTVIVGNFDLKIRIWISISRTLNIIVIVPSDSGYWNDNTYGIDDIGVVPRSHLTDKLTPNAIINNPISRVV